MKKVLVFFAILFVFNILYVTQTNAEANTYKLKVSVAAQNGSTGSVSGGEGIYLPNELVTITAIVGQGSVFAGWNDSDTCSGRALTCTLKMDRNHTAKANFDLAKPGQTTTSGSTGSMGSQNNPSQNGTYSFTTYLNDATSVNNQTPGRVNSSGSISGTQNATKTTAGNTSVTGTYQDGTLVTLTATPGPGSMFLTWFGYGPCKGGNPTCTFVMNGETSGTEAVFKALPSSGANTRYEFNKLVAVQQPHDYGLGAVTVNPSGGTITGTSVGQYAVGTLVNMTAVPNPGYAFAGWSNNGLNSQSAWNSGKCHNQGASCSFVMDMDVIMYAKFIRSSTTTQPPANPGTPTRQPRPGVITTQPPVDTNTGTPTRQPRPGVITTQPPVTPGTTNPGNVSLVVTKAGAAASYGSVTNEGTTSHAIGSRVTLTVTISNPLVVKFAGWNDGNVCSGRSLTCTFTITGNETAKANFDFVNPQSSLLPTSSNLSSDSSNYSPLDLEMGMAHPGVATLQKYLNSNGYVINTNQGEDGSVGHETNYFGEKTRQALIKFQKDKGISPASGFYGPQTRKAMGI